MHWGRDCSTAGKAEPGSPHRASSVPPEHPRIMTLAPLARWLTARKHPGYFEGFFSSASLSEFSF